MPIYRVVVENDDGELRHEDYETLSALLDAFEQSGVEEDSYTIRLHGEPILKGLIGPMSEGKNIVRYESPVAFAVLTERWSKERRNGKRRSR